MQAKTFVAVKFKMLKSHPIAMDYAYYRDGKCCNEGSLKFNGGVGPQLLNWCAMFAESDQLFGRIPVVIGWGERDCVIFDAILEGRGSECGEIAFVDRMIQYFDVEAYAHRRIKDAHKKDGWSECVRKIGRLDQCYAKMRVPTPRACAEMMLALDRPDMSAVIAKAFVAFLKVIMEDGKITTDEAKELRSFVNILTGEYPQFKELERELNEVLEDDVVTDEESKRLMETLGDMRLLYEKFVDSAEDVIPKISDGKNTRG